MNNSTLMDHMTFRPYFDITKKFLIGAEKFNLKMKLLLKIRTDVDVKSEAIFDSPSQNLQVKVSPLRDNLFFISTRNLYGMCGRGKELTATS